MQSKDIKVLVIDDDKLTVMILEKALSEAGLIVKTATHAMDALKLLNIEKFDVVISDIKMPDLNGFEIMIWMKRNNINSKLIMITSTVNPLMRKNYGKYGVVQILEKPLDTSYLVEVVNNSLKEDFKADITDINTFDLVRILLMTNKDKLLTIESDISLNIGKLYVRSGEIIHAEYEYSQGLDAFYKIMSIQNGTFQELEWEEPENRTINFPTDYLLMESARIIDEIFSRTRNDELVAPHEEQIKILIVDDDKTTLEILKNALSKEGYFVTTEESSYKAVETLVQVEYNFLISDINMPEFNGFQLLSMIKKAGINIKVIMMTAFGREEYKTFSMSKGALKYFEKPLDIKELLTYIKTGIQGSLNEVTLLDFIQLVLNSNQRTLVEIYSPLTDLSGRIYIDKGNIIHAEYDGLIGEDAFYGIATIHRGIFSELVWNDPKYQTINKPAISLLMRVSRVMDDIKSENEKVLNKIGEDVDKKIYTLSEKERITNIVNVKDINANQSFLPEQDVNQHKYINPTELFFIEKGKLFMPLECLKYIFPVLTRTGEEYLTSDNIPLDVYQFMKNMNGKNSFDYIYNNYYHHIPLDEFMNKFFPSNYFRFEKYHEIPDYINFNIKLGEILAYMKILSRDALNKMLEVQNLSSTSVGIQKPLGQLLSQLNIVEDEKVKRALSFQNMFKRYILVWL
jgi:DNA-binding response OmpR family regulator